MKINESHPGEKGHHKQLSLQTADGTAAFGYFVTRNYDNEVCEDTSPTSSPGGEEDFGFGSALASGSF